MHSRLEIHGKFRHQVRTIACILLALVATALLTPSHAQTPVPNSEDDSALPLSLTRYYERQYQAPDGSDSKFKGYAGRKIIDGLPFDIDGQITLFGKEEADRNKDHPHAISGIVIGRKFDELHLIHFVDWREYPGCLVAKLRFHYSDGTSADIPIRYGEQVIDWSRLYTEDAEVFTDPHTKIIWRGPGSAEGTGRLFMSELNNPFPNKTAKTLDLISADSGSSYNLVAATVALRDPNRQVTPPMPLLPARNFAGALTVSVIDKKTGEPIAGAEVYPAMVIGDISLVADNVITDKDGIAVVKYPKDAKLGAKDLRIKITKPGYGDCELHWNNGWKAGQVPDQVNYRLAPDGTTGDDAKPDFTLGTPVQV